MRTSSGVKARSRTATAVAYLAMVAVTVALFYVIREMGSTLGHSVGASGADGVQRNSGTRTEILPHVLMALVAIIAAARATGSLFRRILQPAVIGEVVAGIALGPSLLGHFWPDAAAFLFPGEIMPYLSILAQVGVILFMFLVGLELDTSRLLQGTQVSLAISHASIVTPFLLGSTAALWLYADYSGVSASFTVFSLFLGVALSVTAFPVLARILTDRGIQHTPLGILAITCAAVDDITAWCLLALVVSVAHADPSAALATFVLTAVFTGAAILTRPLLLRMLRVRSDGSELTQSSVALMIVCLLCGALATEWIGIHALFGSFLLGALIPHDSRAAGQMREKLEDIVLVLLLPVFFAITGLRTQIGLLQEPRDWLVCAVIVLIASVGKVGGSYVAGRLSGLSPRMSGSVGVLMNTRGLMELIVLNLGLDLGILSPALFAMFVLMALATTLATAPLLHWIGPAEV